jgi:hypothetical protein
MSAAAASFRPLFLMHPQAGKLYIRTKSMNILKNLFKALILVGLIFGVLYFGLSYYYKQQIGRAHV